MKHYRIFLALTVLVVASLACNAFTGSKTTPAAPQDSSSGNQVEQPTAPASSNDSGSNTTVKSDFPMTADAYNVDISDGNLLYFTKMSLEDVMKFYRDEYAAKGYKERELLTVTSETTFNLVFDGDPSGKAVVIQSVDFGNGSCSVAIRLEDV